jgi:hypothetical protein
VKKLNVQRAQSATNAEHAIGAKEAPDPIVLIVVQIIASHIVAAEPSLLMENS